MAVNKRLIKSNEGGAAVPTSFNTVLYTGNGTNLPITGVGFQPDFVWLKRRDAGYPFTNKLIDSVRGATKRLSSEETGDEITEINGLKSFDSDGFTLGGDPGYNINGTANVAWCWKAGGAAVTNTDGTITSQVSANVDAGFSIVNWQGNGGAATHGHGLGVAPDVIILKARNGNTEWFVYHSSLGNNSVLRLYESGAATSAQTVWNLTSPTSTVFTTGSYTNVASSSYNFIAYCFAEVAGFSKFGSYTGNGSTNGPTITTDFEPAFVMIKWSSGSPGNWQIMDNKRGADRQLYANLSNGEGPIYDGVDFLSNGFQLKTDYVEFNGSGQSYIYMAFANQF